ncbi:MULTISPECIES: hypothetical protein [unclassified Streptomyces]
MSSQSGRTPVEAGTRTQISASADITSTAAFDAHHWEVAGR